MGYQLITAPTSDPVTLAEAKSQLRVDHSDEDARIASLIKAATAYLDGRTGILGRCLITQTWELLLDAFPDEDIEIPLGPVSSVTSIKYIDPNGIEQTIPGASYYVDTASLSAWVIPQDEWPLTMRTANAVAVRYVAGAAAAPEPIRHAILLLVATWYENRSTGEIPAAFGALITPFRRLSV